MALVIALALMTGLQQELRDRILGSQAHVYVFKPAGITDYRAEMPKLLGIPHVVGAAPAMLGQGLLSASRETAPVQIKGIDPALEPQVTDIKGAMQSGSLDALEPPSGGDRRTGTPGVDGDRAGAPDSWTASCSARTSRPSSASPSATRCRC